MARFWRRPRRVWGRWLLTAIVMLTLLEAYFTVRIARMRSAELP